MSSEVRVAQLLERLSIGGAENLAVRIANSRAARGAPSYMYALQPGGELSARLEPGTVLRELAVTRGSVRRPWRFAASVLAGRRRLLAQLAHDRIDVIQSHLPEANFWALLAVLKGQTAVVATIHNNQEFHYGETDGAVRRSLRRRAYRQILKRCQATVAVSAAVRDSLVADLGLEAELAERIVVVPNGVDPPALLAPDARAGLRRELGVPDQVPLLLGAGRLTDQKNFIDLIAVAALLRDEGVAAFTVIAGEGEQEADLAGEIRRRDLSGHVRLLGPRHDLGALMQAADCFVLSSLWEGLPLVLLEAMAAGCPVAGYAIAGTADVVTHGREGLLAESGQPIALAGAIATLLADPDLRRACGAAGQALVRERYAFDRVTDTLDELYRRVAHGRG